jgi:hypothetical protein
MEFLRSWLRPMRQLPLGRWTLQYDPQIVHHKIDQANEDHCGCCDVQYAAKRDTAKRDTAKQDAAKKEDAASEDYYVPYIM